MVWNGQSVAVILPTYNERDSIAETIHGFEKLGYVDDILVINNNAAPGTSQEVATTTAREIREPRQGYGAAIRRGLQEVDADLICVCEPDGTFRPADLDKLLPFTAECDLVVGSRTVQTFIWDGANMGKHLRWGNWALAKGIEATYNTVYLSDVGCTFRVVSRSCAADLVERATHTGSAFGLEMLLLAIIRQYRIVQVPVNYQARVGESSVTGHLHRTVALGLRMAAMSAGMRLRRTALRG
jgi:dolichol-phosphate mannosyltransferase